MIAFMPHDHPTAMVPPVVQGTMSYCFQFAFYERLLLAQSGRSRNGRYGA